MRTFLLKIKRNMLWFREVGCDAEWTFGLLTSLEKTSDAAEFWRSELEFLKAWFESELRNGDFGRLVIWNAFGGYEGNFLFLFGADGRGVAREPWDDEGLIFQWKAPQDLNAVSMLDWPFDTFENATEKREYDTKLFNKFGQREPPEPVLKGEPLHWICGSQNELETLTRWAANLVEEVWEGLEEPPQLIFRYLSESEHSQACLLYVTSPKGIGYSPSSVDKVRFERIQRLGEIFLDYNTPVGYQWEFNDLMGGRDSWDASGFSIWIEIPAPSAHEKIEAHLNLREWLRGKVPDEEIERLLQT